MVGPWQRVREYHNVSAWPKHLLIRYRWVESVDVDSNAGMLMMLSLFLAASVVGLTTMTMMM